MVDVLIVGAGPAGAVAAAVLARSGARVRIVDRARFPRDKLCGDTVNPGTLALLRRLGLADHLEGRGLPIAGMILTGADGVAVETPYPDGLQGRALTRRELDWSLLQQAISAGAQFDPGSAVRRAEVDSSAGGPVVKGVLVGDDRTIRARVVIAADGRRSTLAFGLGLGRRPPRPRRWAIGAYFEHVSGLSAFGEMHVRRGSYIGVAAIPDALTNVCFVKPWAGPDPAFRDPGALLRRELARDPLLRERFGDARLATPPVVLGPLAVDVNPQAIPGLLLAGDAAGFIDPITGDGLRFAVRGGELAAQAALEALTNGWSGVHARLDRERRREFAAKWRFNRAVRTLLSSSVGVRLGEAVAHLAPSVLREVVRRAGDCDLSQPSEVRPAAARFGSPAAAEQGMRARR